MKIPTDILWVCKNLTEETKRSCIKIIPALPEFRSKQMSLEFASTYFKTFLQSGRVLRRSCFEIKHLPITGGSRVPVPIVSLLSTVHTGDVSNRGGSKTEHTGQLTLQGDTSRKFGFVEKGMGDFVSYPDKWLLLRTKQMNRETPGYELRQLIKIQ